MTCHRLTTWSHDDNRPVSEARNTNCSCEVKEVKIKLSVLPRFLLFYGLLPLLSLSWSFFTSLISFSQELQSLWSSTGCYCSNTASWKHTHMHCTWAACKCIDSYIHNNRNFKVTQMTKNNICILSDYTEVTKSNEHVLLMTPQVWLNYAVQNAENI